MRKLYYFGLGFKIKSHCCKGWFRRKHSNPSDKASSPAGIKILSNPSFKSIQAFE